MGRKPCCAKEEINRGAWTAEEDGVLSAYIRANGQGKWGSLPKKAGLKRCGKSCRLRWLNYLRPGIKRGNISEDEEDLIIRLHKLLGNRWSLIAGRLPGRTDNEIKNYWNTRLQKKLVLHAHHEQQTAATEVPELDAPSVLAAQRESDIGRGRTTAVVLETKEEEKWWGISTTSLMNGGGIDTSTTSDGLNFDFMEDWSQNSLTSLLNYMV